MAFVALEPHSRDHRRSVRLSGGAACLGLLLLAATPAIAQEPTLDEDCVVAVLNRTARVEPSGTWVLPNVPAGIGQVRLRATCVEDGVTRGGQSDVFAVPADGVIRVQEIRFDDPVPVPERLELAAPATVLGAIGETAQLTVSAVYSDGSAADLSAASTGTNYIVSNPAVATVSPAGLVTAVSSGTVIVSAMNEGASGFLRLQVVLSGDTDGDGIPDDVEVTLGLDPNDPVDALTDRDGDGLTAADEIAYGSDPDNPDSDSDGLTDGEEVQLVGTDPVLFDTDGDGLSDGLEVAIGSDPLDPASYDLAAALVSLSVRPASFVLNANTLLPGEALVRLSVEGELLDGTQIDLTSAARGTSYESSDLLICNFGLDDGVVYAGSEGTCSIRVANSGFEATAEGLIQSFTPSPVSAVNLPSYGNSVAVRDGWAFVAGGPGGLHVVDVSNVRQPRVVTSLPLQGNANDIVLDGSLAYIAAGDAGVHVVDVTVPQAPALVGSADTPGSAIALRIAGQLLFVADGAAGLQVLSVADPAAPAGIGSWDTPGEANGLAVAGGLAVVSTHTAAIEVVDVATPDAPVGLSTVPSTLETFDVEIVGTYAYVATADDLRVVDLSDPLVPVDLGTFGAGFWMIDLLAVDGGGAIFTTQVIPSTRMPVFDLRADRGSPEYAGSIRFSDLVLEVGDGLHIAADERHVYMTATIGFEVDSKPGTTGATRLLIAQRTPFEDSFGQPPTASVVVPEDGAEVAENVPFEVRLEAADDVAVLDVTLLVDGEEASRDAVPPYRFLVNPGPTGSAMHLAAEARDFGGNRSSSNEVVVYVSGGAEPTTVIGRVVDLQGEPVSGARVFTSMGGEATSATDGSFLIERLPVTASQLVAIGSATVGGEELRGRSASVSVAVGGVTDVGAIELTALGLLFPGPTSTIFPTGADVRHLEVFDVDQDGRLDAVGASQNQIGILLGRGDGSFAPRLDLAASPNVSDLVLGDVDGDGRIDLVLVDRDLDELWVYLGHGDGTFASPTKTTVPTDVGSVAVGDVDLDGVLDAVTDSASSAQALVFRGRGDGTFDTPSIVALPEEPREVGLGDFDGDGILDLVSLSELAVSFGHGNGTFGPATALLPGEWVRHFVVEDLDVDGLPDLLGLSSSSSTSRSVSGQALLSRGGRTFQNFYVGFLGEITDVATGYVDLDEVPDLVGLGKHSTDDRRTARVHLGPEVFSTPGANYPRVTQPDVGKLSGFSRVVVASMDGDGVPDLVVGREKGAVSVFSGQGDGSFRTYERSGNILFGTRLHPGDLDRDGLSDLVTGSGSKVRTYFQNADGSFLQGSEVTVASAGSLLLVDLNFDGAVDVVACGSSTLSVLVNSGAGVLSSPVEYVGQSGMARPVAGDVTGDGWVDVVVTRGGSLGVFANDGGGGLQTPSFWSIGGTFTGLDLVDFDGDGDLDAVLSDGGESELILAANDGTGSFSRTATLPVAEVNRGFSGWGSSEPRAVRAADVDRDGVPDLIAVNFVGRDLSLFRGLGAGSFEVEERLPVGIGPWDQAIVDVDVDGLLDLVVVNAGSDDLSVLRGREDGSFALEERYTTGGRPQTIEVFLRAGSAFPSLVIGSDTGFSGGKEANFLDHE